MKECERIQDQLEAFEFGFLDEATAIAIREHVSGCSECREALVEVRRTIGLLEKLPATESPTPAFAGRPVSRIGTRSPSSGGRWLRVLAALWLLSLGLGAWAITTTLSRARESESALVDAAQRLVLVEERLSGLEAAQLAQARGRDSLGTEFERRLDEVEDGLAASRGESSRLRDADASLQGRMEQVAQVHARTEEIARTVAELQTREAAMGSSLEEHSIALEAQLGAIAGLASRLAAAESPPGGRATRPASNPTAADLVARAPEVRGPSGGASDGPSAKDFPAKRSAQAQAQAQTPWDAAFRMASGTVQGRGGRLTDRIQAYEDDLFRIYGDN